MLTNAVNSSFAMEAQADAICISTVPFIWGLYAESFN